MRDEDDGMIDQCLGCRALQEQLAELRLTLAGIATGLMRLAEANPEAISG